MFYAHNLGTFGTTDVDFFSVLTPVYGSLGQEFDYGLLLIRYIKEKVFHRLYR